MSLILAVSWNELLDMRLLFTLPKLALLSKVEALDDEGSLFIKNFF
jgi:hypothetical protein